MGKSVEQLVNQEFLRWLSAQRAKDSVPESHARQMQRPMITISREYGARGGELGQQLAHLLGIDFFGQEIVHEVAKTAEVRRQVVEALDERTRSRVELWVDQLLRLRTFEVDDYIRSLSQTVVAIARHSRGVIVGRGAHLMLDKSRTLRLRCVARLEDRIAYVRRREQVSQAEARAKVERVDRERSEFFKTYFGTDISAPASFDLVVNTSTLCDTEAVTLACSLYRERYGD